MYLLTVMLKCENNLQVWYHMMTFNQLMIVILLVYFISLLLRMMLCIDQRCDERKITLTTNLTCAMDFFFLSAISFRIGSSNTTGSLSPALLKVNNKPNFMSQRTIHTQTLSDTPSSETQDRSRIFFYLPDGRETIPVGCWQSKPKFRVTDKCH